jgi:hypothetical protein
MTCLILNVFQFAVELWRFMEEKKLNIGQSGYLYILCALCKGGYLDEVSEIIYMTVLSPDRQLICASCFSLRPLRGTSFLFV